MGGQTRLLAIRPALASLLIAVLCSILSCQAISAQSVDVNAIIPEGIILVQGKASPNALVKLYENDNDQPTASIVADSNGDFSEELPQMSTGVVDIGIQAVDTNGIKSTLITKQVAIISQQTSTLTIILPPTVTLQPESAPFGDGTMEFSGRTIPGATVKVTIEPSTILSIAADSQGNYTIPLLIRSLAVGMYTYGIEVTAGSEVSDYVIAGTLVITPPVQPSVLAPDNPLQRFVRRFVSQSLRVPEISSPSKDEYTSSGPFVISGSATPGAEVTLYDAGEIIGVVLARQGGTWQFYFSPHKETHTIYAQSCQNGRCSENSRSIIIRRPASSGTCAPSVRLTSYRLSTIIRSEAELTGNILRDVLGTAVISWGDGSDEKFDIPSGEELQATHAYQEAGIYSGYIILNTGDSCQSTSYFTVEAKSPTQSVSSTILITTIIIGVISVAWIIRRALLISRP